MLDHAGAVRRGDIAGASDAVAKLAGVHRELAANDVQFSQAQGLGPREARNVELTLPKPALVQGAAQGAAGTVGGADGGGTAVGGESRGVTPATGGPGWPLAAMLATAGAVGLHRLRTRMERAHATRDLPRS